jgi:hypothetical protein
VTVSPYALTTLAEAKQHAGITTSTEDARLTAYVNAASSRIEAWTEREFVARERTFERVALRGGRGIVRHYPVVSVAAAVMSRDEGLSIRHTDATSISARVAVTSTGITLSKVNSSGVASSTTITFAAQLTLAMMAAAIGGVSGWSATARAIPGLSAWLCEGSGPAKDGPYSAQCYGTDASCVVEDAETGLISMGGADWTGYFGDQEQALGCDGLAYITYTAGLGATTADLPADLRMLCCELVKAIYDNAQRATGMAQETIDDYTYRLSDSTFTGMEETWRERLRRYKRVSIGGGG